MHLASSFCGSAAFTIYTNKEHQNAFKSTESAPPFYNLAIFMSSIAVFSLVAQRMGSTKAIGS
ncbi:hypothetical protein BDW02DRAFT_601251 [Decorospora gaudefroyi]|uniref:Uncharacterized protein n=1 Tax=Decorospora gaudefroyi TaxID=184978 RepID=A0A6A5K0U0_9PLEO|nr:hypothetical protein BDW02DRAFT_601251 [Decorospora gaudefroyi]